MLRLPANRTKDRLQVRIQALGVPVSRHVATFNGHFTEATNYKKGGIGAQFATQSKLPTKGEGFVCSHAATLLSWSPQSGGDALTKKGMEHHTSKSNLLSVECLRPVKVPVDWLFSAFAVFQWKTHFNNNVITSKEI